MQKLIFNTIDVALHLHFQSWQFPLPKSRKNIFQSLQFPNAEGQHCLAAVTVGRRRTEAARHQQQEEVKRARPWQPSDGARRVGARRERARSQSEASGRARCTVCTNPKHVRPGKDFSTTPPAFSGNSRGPAGGLLADSPPGSWSPPAGHQCSRFLFLWSRSAKPATYTPTHAVMSHSDES